MAQKKLIIDLHSDIEFWVPPSGDESDASKRTATLPLAQIAHAPEGHASVELRYDDGKDEN